MFVNLSSFSTNKQINILQILNLGIYGSSSLEEVELLDVVIPQHGGGQLGVEVGVVPGASHDLVLSVDWTQTKNSQCDGIKMVLPVSTLTSFIC